MIHLANQYGIPPDVASGFSPAELMQEVQERQLEARDRAIREQSRPAPQVTPPAPTPEPDFELPPEVAEELRELNPAMLKALQAVGKASVKRATEKFEKEVAAVRAQASGSTIAARVAATFNTMPDVFGANPPPNSVEAEKRDMVLSYLIAQEQAGISPGAPEQAIPALAKKFFGAKAATPASPPSPPAPTPTARPTNQRSDDSGLTIEQQNIEMWRKAIDEAEDAERAGDPGHMNRP